ncbi:MAG: HEAT repeat protein [Planctomycetota bacterium]|jgi:HEAT repeat protein
MIRAFRFGRLALGATLLLSGLASAQKLSAAVSVECGIRERALFAELYDWNLPEDADWSARYAWLDALTRRAPGGLETEQVVFVLDCLEHEHPNVRAAALLASARHGLPIAEDGELQTVERLAADPLPAVRKALARSLGRMPGTSTDSILLALEADLDEEVASEARAQLLSRGEISLEAQLALFEVAPMRLSADEFMGVLFVLDHLVPNLPLLQGAESQLLSVKEKPGIAARLALLAAMRHGRKLGYDRNSLALGWTARMDSESSEVERARRERLLDGVERGDGSIYPDLIQAAIREDRLYREGAAESEAALERALWYLEGAMQAFYAQPEQRLRSLQFMLPAESSDEFLVEYWTRVSGLAPVWGNYGEEVFYDLSPEVRGAAFEAFVESWTRNGNSGAGRLLVKALDYPDLARDAYCALVGVGFSNWDLDAGRVWWRKQEAEERMSLLREHVRGVPFDAWLNSLLSAWSNKETRQVTVPELLAGFSGNAEVEELLYLWINRELLVLEASAVPERETTRGAWREAESRALWLTRAWMSVRTVPRQVNEMTSETDLLLRVGRLDKELGKALAARLVKTLEGRTKMMEIVEREEISRRLRFEILLLNTEVNNMQMLDELFEYYETCDAELRLRILRRAQGLESEALRTLLMLVIADGGASSSERQAAIATLGTGTAAEVVPLLSAYLTQLHDYELRRAVILALGSCAKDLSGLGLIELYAEEETRLLYGDDLLPVMIEIDVRGTGSPSQASMALWREEAKLRSAQEMAMRFRGEPVPDRNFTYKGWLRAASAIIAAGDLEAALGQDWLCWDGRLLERLGDAVAESGDQELRNLERLIGRAALAALLGERDAPDRGALIVRLRARLLQNSRRAGDWDTAEGWAFTLLDDLRCGRTTDNALESILGGYDRPREHDPLHWLLTIEMTMGVWRAHEADRPELARELLDQARSLSGISAAARSSVSRLARALGPTED